ncbi:MAG: trypsin-like peptidase domain-containing protein [Nocardioidaceae bacterium]|nr:trypsin-like peptidase domain-containing protein [Nocardioidaceae bacterium]
MSSTPPPGDNGYTGHAYETTSQLPAQPPYSSFSGPPPPPPSPPSVPPQQSHRHRHSAALIAAAVLAGALAGVGGAAGYDAVDRPDTVATSRTNALDADAASSQDAGATRGGVQSVAQQVLPSVVQINVAGPQSSGSGTGVILSSDGQILTNNHVVEAAAASGSITVLFADGTTADAAIVGRDPLTDVAVIQAEDVSDLESATLGRSADLEVGQQVVAVGSPFGLESTVTSGIVSALNRAVSSGSDNGTAGAVFPGIQTDAAINPGNSGGPLVDMSGQVVGINSAIRTASTSVGSQGGSIGLGFAIPIDLARSIAEQIIAGEAPTHARIGVSVSDAVDSQALTTVGARVGEVTDGSAADKAGLKPGDVITQVDATLVSGSDGLVATIRGYRPGDEVTLTYQRDGDTRETEVTLDSDGGTPAA